MTLQKPPVRGGTPRADLHVHTYYSDGMMSPEAVAQAAEENGVALVAVTDHDNMNGCDAFAAEAERRGLTAVRGLEISAYSSVKVHVLGYNVDKDCKAYRDFSNKLAEGAEERARDVLSKLKKRGVNLTMSEVLRERKCDRSPVHTMYVARAAARKGYGRSPSDFYLFYLASGKCAYSGIGRPTPEQAVQIIRECGGVSSLAHPGRITLGEEERTALVKSLADCGLDGIEAVYSGHTDRETAHFKEIAQRFSLLVTGGSDTHYAEGNRRIGTPEFYPDERLLAALKLV